MDEEPIDAQRLNQLIEELPEDGKRYLRMCIESVVRCFMEDSTQIGVLIVADMTKFGVNIMSMGIDDEETNRLLKAVLINKAADAAAMSVPKEKLN
jgi:hypothetical protein